MVRTCETSEVHERSTIFLEYVDGILKFRTAEDIVQSIRFGGIFESASGNTSRSRKVVGFDQIPARHANAP
jgi:hypothetical protein